MIDPILNFLISFIYDPNVDSLLISLLIYTILFTLYYAFSNSLGPLISTGLLDSSSLLSVNFIFSSGGIPVPTSVELVVLQAILVM